MGRLVKALKIGTVSYSKGLLLQKHFADLHNKNYPTNSNVLLCLEHHPVYTTGIRTEQYTDSEVTKLKQKGAEFFRANRGGLITFHGPGQLVVYPILDLRQFNPSVRWYVSQIEKTIINLCQKYELKAETSPHTGVWIGDEKICAIGIRGSRFITTHGLALNCSTDLSWFDHIVPCGIEGKGVTSLSKELNRTVTVEEVIPKFLDSFAEVFECDVDSSWKLEVEEIVQNVGV
ncbi:unnamed protein product [Phaedon cochleariae]|uniref:Octanoyl-[acyl-carrier-protein]:protein N-octanoyltransferase LIPT2, mitochondrial n=1 Tax=Phaedon cochleariae TaxID=80249 RepID=A0A9P0GIQ2_PHACE|nr:unnamed protein product [Phaedon cochleariae]